MAVDNILERLVGAPEHREVFKKKGVGVTRLGHPARVVANLQNSTLDAQCTQSSEAQLVKDISKEIEGIMNELKRQMLPPATSLRKASPRFGAQIAKSDGRSTRIAKRVQAPRQAGDEKRSRSSQCCVGYVPWSGREAIGVQAIRLGNH